MLHLSFTVTEVRPVPNAAAPLLSFRLRIQEAVGTPVHGILLRAQMQLHPRRRSHSAEEQLRLHDVFGEPDRWRETLKPLTWMLTSIVVPAFRHEVEIEMLVACSYDMEVLAAKYLQSLDGGDVPVLFLFSGTVFTKTENGFHVQQVAWDQEAAFRFPVSVWRELMQSYFPGKTWIRLRRESVDALQRFQRERGLMSWDDVVDALLAAQQEPVR